MLELAAPVAGPFAPPAKLLSLPKNPKAPEAAPLPHCAPTAAACCLPGLATERAPPGAELPGGGEGWSAKAMDDIASAAKMEPIAIFLIIPGTPFVALQKFRRTGVCTFAFAIKRRFSAAIKHCSERPRSTMAVKAEDATAFQLLWTPAR
jgi:hypothetical protein